MSPLAFKILAMNKYAVAIASPSIRRFSDAVEAEVYEGHNYRNNVLRLELSANRRHFVRMDEFGFRRWWRIEDEGNEHGVIAVSCRHRKSALTEY